MPIFPADDIGPYEDQWQFFRIDALPNGDIEFESLGYWATHVASVKYKDFSREPGQKADHPGISRIRSSAGGGFYPNLHIALTHLLYAFKEEGVWVDYRCPPLGQQVDFDILLQSNVSYVKGATDQEDRFPSVPFVLSAAMLKKHPKTAAAMKDVLKALKKDAPRAMQVWERFPEEFSVRQTAMEEIRMLLRPATPRRRRLAAQTHE